MGFGLLLIGYMFAFLAKAGLGPYIFAGMAVGSTFMFFGLKELRKYSPVFIYALIGSVLLFICSILGGVSWGIGTFTENDVSILNKIFDIIKIAVNLFFEISMLYGIADLSRRVDYPDTRQKAFTNMIYVGVFNILQIATLLPIVRSAVMTVLIFAQLIYTGINTFLIFKCYAMICPAGQEEMKRKKSRFAFINKFHEIKDAKDDKAIEEMKNYYEDKLRKRNAKKKSKKKK
jgi:hypothetical protein